MCTIREEQFFAYFELSAKKGGDTSYCRFDYCLVSCPY